MRGRARPEQGSASYAAEAVTPCRHFFSRPTLQLLPLAVRGIIGCMVELATSAPPRWPWPSWQLLYTHMRDPCWLPWLEWCSISRYRQRSHCSLQHSALQAGGGILSVVISPIQLFSMAWADEAQGARAHQPDLCIGFLQQGNCKVKSEAKKSAHGPSVHMQRSYSPKRCTAQANPECSQPVYS